MKDFPELKDSGPQILKSHRVSTGSLWKVIQACLWIEMGLVLPKVVVYNIYNCVWLPNECEKIHAMAFQLEISEF